MHSASYHLYPLALKTLFTLSILSGLSACSSDSPTTTPPAAGPDVLFPIRIGDRTVKVQLAVTPSETERGLSKHTELEPMQGMLFIFRQPGSLRFWMKDTSIALDIGYFSREGFLKEIYPMFPYNLDTIASHDDQLQIALEVNQGWFAQNKIAVGAQLDMATVRSALKARGFDLNEFGL